MKKRLTFILTVILLLGGFVCGNTPSRAREYPGAIVSLNANTTATSYISGGESGNASDGVGATKWISQPGDYSCNVLRISLPREEVITRWVVKHAGYAGDSTYLNTRDFELRYTDSYGVSHLIDSVYGNSYNITDRWINPVRAKDLELVILNPNANNDYIARICEWEVYNSNNCVLNAVTTNTEFAKAYDGKTSTVWQGQNYYGYNGFGASLSRKYMVDHFTVRNAGSAGFDPLQNTRDFQVLMEDGSDGGVLQQVSGNTANVAGKTFTPVYIDYLTFMATTPTQPGAVDPNPRVAEFELYTDTPNQDDIILDNNSNRCYTTGYWTIDKTSVDRWQDDYYYTTKGPGSAFFNVNVPRAGIYDVYVHEVGDSSSCTSVEHTIYYGVASSQTTNVNQMNDSGIWHHIGRFYVDRGQGAIKVTVPTTPVGKVSVDAVRFKWVQDNLTANASVSASSENYYLVLFSKRFYYSAIRATDNNTSHDYNSTLTWESRDPLPQWLEIAFNEPRKFNQIKLYLTTDRIMRDYYIQVWNCEINNWQTIETVTGNTLDTRLHSFNTILGTKIRIVGTNGSTQVPTRVSINEVQVYYNDMPPAY